MWHLRFFQVMTVANVVLAGVALFKPEVGSALAYAALSLACSAHARLEGER